MNAIAKSFCFVTAGALILQLSLTAVAQEGKPPAGAVPIPSGPQASVSSAAASLEQASNSRATSGREAVTEPGKAGDTGDPALGGERHPLYRLAKSDVVEITFTLSPEFNQSVTVQPDGFVFLRDAGLLYAEGLTLNELRGAILQAYAGILHQPPLSVTLKDFERPYFLASGEVVRPGKYELRGELTVSEAVAIAGGLTKQARHSQVVLFRRITPEMAEAHMIDLKKMLSQRDLREDLHLRAGDFIVVPQSRISKIARFVPTNTMNWYINPVQF